ncbi:MAG: hypothetical protein AN484_26670, partial [Aphanizomenon flos-aquae WA102]
MKVDSENASYNPYQFKNILCLLAEPLPWGSYIVLNYFSFYNISSFITAMYHPSKKSPDSLCIHKFSEINDQLSKNFVIQTAGTISRCNDIAPSRFQIAGRWYCMFPEMRECGAPEELPVQAVKIDEGKTTGLGLGRSIYTQDQIQAFVDFQDAHQVRRAYLAETAEIAYAGRGPNGEWGHGLGGLASASVVSLVGSHLIPL